MTSPSPPEPTIPMRTARGICAQRYRSLERARETMKRLRRTRWQVIEVPEHLQRRLDDGTVRIASIYHPATGESPSDVRYIAPHDPE